MNPSPQPPRFSPERALELGRRTLDIEASAVAALSLRLDTSFAAAVAMILDSRGRLVVSGMGKSGHIARKIAATMASTGTPAYFVHPAEASHGDLGMVTRDDVLIAISHSGESAEIISILPALKRQGARIIACALRTSTVGLLCHQFFGSFLRRMQSFAQVGFGVSTPDKQFSRQRL